MSPVTNRLIAPAHLELDPIRSWLQQEVEWADGLRLRDVRLRRLRVGRHGRFAFELALDLTCEGVLHTHMLQGGSGPAALPPRYHTHGRVSRHGLAGLRLVNNELGVWCCTPDRDHKLTIIRDLLNDRRLAWMLAGTVAAEIVGLGDRASPLQSEIAAYRANKRCVLRVRPSGNRRAGSVFLRASNKTHDR